MIKTLAKCVREYKTASLLAPLFVVLEVIMEVLVPYLMASLIDNGINKQDMDYVWKMGLIILGAAVLSLLFGTLSGRFAAVASAGFAKNVRHDMFYRIQRFSFSNIDRFSTSSLITRMTTDVSNVQNAYQMIIRIAFRAPFMMIFAMVMSFNVNVSLSFTFVIFIPIIAVALALIVRFAFPNL